MPAYDIDSQRNGGSFDPQPIDGWSMPIGSFGGIQFFMSYSVFVALAVLAGVVALVQNSKGNGDLPLVALIAVSIWVTGWLAQLVVQYVLNASTPAKSESITVGLFGVEIVDPLRRVHPWSAGWVLCATLMSIAALILFGIASLVIHVWTHPVDPLTVDAWFGELGKSSFGLDDVSNSYLAATWLFWIQAACQAFPLPRNLGRGGLAAAIALLSKSRDERQQVASLKRLVQYSALLTVAVGAASMLGGDEIFLPRWPFLALLALMLWISANNQDLVHWVASMRAAKLDPAQEWLYAPELGGGPSPMHADSEAREEAPPERSTRRRWLTEIADSVRMRQKRKRAQAALAREREEANDVAQLDHVLKKVSQSGTDSLSEDERALLHRVSGHLRKQRATDDANPDKQ